MNHKIELIASKKKILIIRFNSIGDIVLTTPVIKMLHDLGYEVHYLLKSSYASVLEFNPYVSRLITLDSSLSDILPELASQDYDRVIDLHNNIRSKRVCSALKKPVLRLKKERVGLWLLTQWGIGKFQRDHIVDRFLDIIKPLTKDNVNPSLPQYFLKSEKSGIEVEQDYMVIAIGAAYATKQIPINLIVEVIDQTDIHCVLLGGKEDVERATQITNLVEKEVDNLTGKLSISESASMIQKARLVLSGDTGMMHIANALGTPVVAVFGSTHPILGYRPYDPHSNKKNIVIQNNDLTCRPCTKQGKHKCPKRHFKCMKELKSSDIIDKIQAFI